jgi:uncharacterized membrane protein
MKKYLMFLLMMLLIPATLALEPETYFVTSEISEDTVLEEVEIVGYVEILESFQLTLPLNVKDVQVLFNANKIECELEERLGLNILTCSVEPYTGTYFIKLNYQYRPINLDGEILFRTTHKPEAENFIFIAKLSEDYQVPLDELEDLISPPPTSKYTESGRQIFAWKLDNLETFEATIVAKSVSQFKAAPLIAFLIALIIVLAFFKFRKKKISPKFTEPEQKIVEALKKQKKAIKQKELQRLTGFSKARLSRMLNNLEEREVIQKKPWGRTNLIELKRK